MYTVSHHSANERLHTIVWQVTNDKKMHDSSIKEIKVLTLL